MTLWGEPEWVHMQNIEYLHVHTYMIVIRMWLNLEQPLATESTDMHNTIE